MVACISFNHTFISDKVYLNVAKTTLPGELAQK